MSYDCLFNLLEECLLGRFNGLQKTQVLINRVNQTPHHITDNG